MSIIPNINNQSIAILSDIEQWKDDIADAINTKGGNSTPDESFQQLAEDIQTLPYAGISAEGMELIAPFILSESLFNSYVPVKKITTYRYTITKAGIVSYATDLEEFVAPFVTRIEASSFTDNNNKLKIFYAPLLTDYAKTLVNATNIKDITVGRIASNIVGGHIANFLRNITATNIIDYDCSISFWTATNVISEGQSGIDELNSNLYNNLLTKLYDHSDDGETRTLRIGWLAHVTQENIDYANSKGWTLTT